MPGYNIRRAINAGKKNDPCLKMGRRKNSVAGFYCNENATYI